MAYRQWDEWRPPQSGPTSSPWARPESDAPGWREASTPLPEQPSIPEPTPAGERFADAGPLERAGWPTSAGVRQLRIGLAVLSVALVLAVVALVGARVVPARTPPTPTVTVTVTPVPVAQTAPAESSPINIVNRTGGGSVAAPTFGILLVPADQTIISSGWHQFDHSEWAVTLGSSFQIVMGRLDVAAGASVDLAASAQAWAQGSGIGLDVADSFVRTSALGYTAWCAYGYPMPLGSRSAWCFYPTQQAATFMGLTATAPDVTDAQFQTLLDAYIPGQ